MKRREKVQVIQDEEKPVEKKILARAIVDISESVSKLRASGLNESAILALVKDDIGMPKSKIKDVLQSLARLRQSYCS